MTRIERRTEESEALFFEPYAAATSLKNAWTRSASTYGCMMILLSRETLTIRPHWFARWIISLLGLDLYHEIPVSKIRGLEKVGQWYSYGKVELRFVTTGGEERRILLYMKKHRELINMVKKLHMTDRN